MSHSNQRIVIRHFGRPFREATEIVEEPIGHPGPGEVLIRNAWAGVNGIYDRAMCVGRIRGERPPGLMGTGVEAIGTVVDIGDDVVDFEIGDTVATVRTGFGYTQFHCCPSDLVVPVPELHPEIVALVPTG